MGFNGIGHFADLFGPSTTTAVEQLFQQQHPSFQLQQQQQQLYEECCVPTGDCVMRSMPIRPEDPRAAELYTRVVCSDAGCPAGRYMHRECFDSWERLVVAYMKNVAKAGRHVKDLWTVNVNNNNVVNLNKQGFDMANKMCGCRCGRGYLKMDSEWPSSSMVTAVRRQSSSGSGGSAEDVHDRSVSGIKKKKRRQPKQQLPSSCNTTACNAQPGAMIVDHTEFRLRAGSLSGSSNGSNSPVTGGSNSASSVSPVHSGSYGSGASGSGSSSSNKRRGATATCFKDVFER